MSGIGHCVRFYVRPAPGPAADLRRLFMVRLRFAGLVGPRLVRTNSSAAVMDERSILPCRGMAEDILRRTAAMAAVEKFPRASSRFVGSLSRPGMQGRRAPVRCRPPVRPPARGPSRQSGGRAWCPR
jgi:hypothetical protein